MLSDIWKMVYDAARMVVNPKKISEQICSGGVGAAVLTKMEIFIQVLILIQIVHLVCVRSEMPFQQ